MENLSKKEKYLIIITIIIIILSSIVYNRVKSKEIYVNNEKYDNDYEKNLKNDELNYEENDIMMVHIGGAVKNPGVIEFNSGDRLVNIIDKCGGLLEEADENSINLAKRLTDEEKIYIPFEGEELSNEDLIIENDPNSELIDINNCSKEELITLPGIGDKTADKIIDYRENNLFDTVEDIMNVSGIGEKKYEAIEDLIIVR